MLQEQFMRVFSLFHPVRRRGPEGAASRRRRLRQDSVLLVVMMAWAACCASSCARFVHTRVCNVIT